MDPFDIIDIIGKVISIFKKIRKTQQWRALFTNVGDSILNLEHDEGELFDQINILFSKENLKSIAEENRSSGYELVEQIRNKLINFFTSKDLYTEERQVYIDLFIDAFKNQLKIKFPEEYDKIFINDFRNENKQDHIEISEGISELKEKIDEIKDNSINILTCYELNKWYITNTKKQCTLELFNHENKEFANELLRQLSKSMINIKSENVFETVAYITYLFLNDERFIEFKDKFRIVEDDAYFGDIRTLIPETSGQHIGNIRTAYRKHPDTLSS